MSQIFDFSGSIDFFRGGAIYPNSKEASVLSTIGRNVDLYYPTRKRSRVSAPFVLCAEKVEEKVSIDALPDECLFEVFRRLDGAQERSSSACVSKRWLMLLSSIHRDEIPRSLNPKKVLVPEKAIESSETNNVDAEVKDEEVEDDGYLSRCLEGKKATDIRLAAISVGTVSRGGLGKLSIRGSNSSCGVTNLGLRAIARGCPSLRVLSLWNVSSVGDEGLLEIANGCNSLEKLDLLQCPAISDKALVAIAMKCPKLASLTIESCASIGNESLKALGLFCPNLKSIFIKNCPLVGDQGIGSLFSSPGCSLKKVKLQALNITDMALAVIGHYGKSVTDLSLVGLQNVNERGFWVMGTAQGLQSLRSFTITSCQGVTDLGVEAVGKGSPNLKVLCLKKCPLLSDNGLVSFAKVSGSLERLQLEECHRITQSGLFGVLINRAEKIKAVSLAKCFGIKDMVLCHPLSPLCKSLRSLTIQNCPGFGNASLAALGQLCPQLENIDLSGISGVTDEGLLSLIESPEAILVKVNVSGCVNLTDKSISTIVKLHGWTLEEINIEGCKYITDTSLVAIAESCFSLRDLNLSKCPVTDKGIATLACVGHLNLQSLSLSECPYLSDKSFPFLVKLGKTLLGLNIHRCRMINNAMVDLLMETLWRCDILF